MAERPLDALRAQFYADTSLRAPGDAGPGDEHALTLRSQAFRLYCENTELRAALAPYRKLEWIWTQLTDLTLTTDDARFGIECTVAQGEAYATVTRQPDAMTAMLHAYAALQASRKETV